MKLLLDWHWLVYHVLLAHNQLALHIHYLFSTRKIIFPSGYILPFLKQINTVKIAAHLLKTDQIFIKS